MIGNENESDGTCLKAKPTDPCDNRDFLPFGNPEGALGTEVALNHPSDIEFYPNGDALLTAWHNNKLRLWDAATGKVKVIAGDDYGYIGDGGPAYMAEFNLPKGSAIDASGRIYVVDSRNQKVRTLEPDGDRRVSTVLGTGLPGFSGDGGAATEAQIFLEKTGTIPEGSVVLTDEYLYLADSSNNRIRRVSLATNIVDCIAGKGTGANTGDGGPAIEATLNKPLDIELGPDNRLYVADTLNNVIRAIDLDTGRISHVAGTGEPCLGGARCLEAEEGMPAEQVRLNGPSGIGFDAQGNLYISDQFNNRIVRIARDW
jgi:sugar lactone lactonase YvrE